MIRSSEDLGYKHRCLQCGALFYDMGHSEPVCPSCGAVHNIDDAIKLKPFRAEEKLAPSDEPDIEDDDSDDDEVLTTDEDDLDDDVAESIKPKETEPEE